MSDDKPRDTTPDETPDETQPVRPEGDAPAAASYADAPAQRQGFRERFRRLRRSDGDRSFGLAALIASALAGVIVGGVGVAAVHAVTDDRRDGPGWGERHGPMGRDVREDRGRGFGGPGRMPGQLQPTTPPDEDDGSSSSS